MVYEVGVIGGGISGSVTALQLANNKIRTVLFEQKDSLINGPPFCHLHAGGNLYPDITDKECRLLMKQSIEMARLFPQSIDRRPTLISIPKNEKLEPIRIEQRLKMLVEYYKNLVKDDRENCVLGEPDDYYKVYNLDELRSLKDKPWVDNPQSLDDWMCNATKIIDLNKLKTPLFMVQEYGWNMFRLAAQGKQALDSTEYCDIKTNTRVTLIEDLRGKGLDHNWKIHTDTNTFKLNYLVNSSGFKTGSLEKPLRLKRESLIEFKAAYISKWDNSPGLLPELIFHGERGTPEGMTQLTPYYGNYYQIHGMTKDITLFDKGLIKENDHKDSPGFDKKISKRLNSGWESDDIKSRTEKAIDFVTRFLPTFKDAVVGGPPLFGAQQIPGGDTKLRVSEVSFPEKFYARSEIIKASSALTVANRILMDLQVEVTESENSLVSSVSTLDIDREAKEIANRRGYPEDMATLLIRSE